MWILLTPLLISKFVFGHCVCVCVGESLLIQSRNLYLSRFRTPRAHESIMNWALRVETQREPVSDTEFTFSTSRTVLSASLHSCPYNVSTGVSSGRLFWISISCSALSERGYWCEKTKSTIVRANDYLLATGAGRALTCGVKSLEARCASVTVHLPFRQ